MTDTPDAGADLRQRLEVLIQQLRDEVADRLDQLLDELGAAIGGE